MNTTYYNNYGCSPIQQEACAQIHGGSFSLDAFIVYAIGYTVGYVIQVIDEMKTVINIVKQLIN